MPWVPGHGALDVQRLPRVSGDHPEVPHGLSVRCGGEGVVGMKR